MRSWHVRINHFWDWYGRADNLQKALATAINKYVDEPSMDQEKNIVSIEAGIDYR